MTDQYWEQFQWMHLIGHLSQEPSFGCYKTSEVVYYPSLQVKQAYFVVLEVELAAAEEWETEAGVVIVGESAYKICAGETQIETVLNPE